MLFGAEDRLTLARIMEWRRDVRHFRPDPVPDALLRRLAAAMDRAPSVGNARPWRVRQVISPGLRARIAASFETANASAAARQPDDRRTAYQALKLAGLREAPVLLCVFTDTAPASGHGLGRQTMPQTLAYSTVGAIHSLWLAARAENLGLGWVSILEPAEICAALDAPATWDLAACLCLGWPESRDDTPLLHRSGWQRDATTDWVRV